MWEMPKDVTNADLLLSVKLKEKTEKYFTF